MSNADELMVSEKTAYNYLNAGLFDADITQHFRCQTENFQGCDLPLQKSKRQFHLWGCFTLFLNFTFYIIDFINYNCYVIKSKNFCKRCFESCVFYAICNNDNCCSFSIPHYFNQVLDLLMNCLEHLEYRMFQVGLEI